MNALNVGESLAVFHPLLNIRELTLEKHCMSVVNMGQHSATVHLLFYIIDSTSERNPTSV